MATSFIDCESQLTSRSRPTSSSSEQVHITSQSTSFSHILTPGTSAPSSINPCCCKPSSSSPQAEPTPKGPIFTPDYDPHSPIIPPRPSTPLFLWDSHQHEVFDSSPGTTKFIRIIRLFTWKNLWVCMKGSLPFLVFLAILGFFIWYNHFNNKLLSYYNYSRGF